MYGKVLGTTNVATGIALLPSAGNHRLLFIAAVSLLVAGVAIFVAATIVAMKSRGQTDTK